MGFGNFSTLFVQNISESFMPCRICFNIEPYDNLGTDAGDAGISATFNLRYFTGRSLDDALAASVSGETFLFVITCES